MSNIINKYQSSEKTINVVITNGTESQLKAYENNNTPISAKNSLIISVKTDSNGKDIPGSASLWITDSDGYILQLTKPINQQ